ncbi:CBS domain-containing protein [Piscinibacter sp.]|uniref:CBS domain-containing protein n=1 Tax=Piscinibacter sp. TaxID=1903157 RepID=UPI002BFFCD4A|nr:CBS domain-containing protein [Albitalea sp.]HUG25261.1 CBS domain-containing protein [Albitalea sp.]
MRVLEMCTRDVVTCTRETSVVEVARRMRDHHVGDLVVVDTVGDVRTPVGIVTDRDLVVLVLARTVDPETLVAGDVMSEAPVTVLASEPLYDAVCQMRSQGIRRLPVVDARGSLSGILTIDDVMRFLADELAVVSSVAPRQVTLERQALAPLEVDQASAVRRTA